MEENIKCFCGNKSFHLLCTLEMCLRKIDITYEENFKFITTTYITRDEFESCKNILKENTIDKMSRNYLLQRKFSKKSNFYSISKRSMNGNQNKYSKLHKIYCLSLWKTIVRQAFVTKELLCKKIFTTSNN